MDSVENSPENTSVDSPSTEVDNATIEANLDNQLRGIFNGTNPDEGLETNEEAPVEDQVSEETSEVEENPTEESVEETPIEADSDEEKAEDLTTEEDEAPEGLDEVDPESLSNFMFPTKDGLKSWSQIEAQLGQVSAASKKSREASQQLKEIEAKREEIRKEEEWLKQRLGAVEINDELATQVNQYKSLQTQLDKAVKEQDSHNSILIREKMNNLSAEINNKKHKVERVRREALSKHTNAQAAILKEKGYGNIVNDNYMTYLKANASQEAMFAINSDATLAIMAEKARKFDLSQKKGLTAKRKKDSDQPSIRAGSEIKNPTAKEKQAKLEAKVQAGKATDEEANAVADSNYRNLFRNKKR